MEDRFFERVSGGKVSHAELRYSRIHFGVCIVRIDDEPPELIYGTDDLEWSVGERIAELERTGYKPAAGPVLAGVQTPAVIERITGHRVPVRYAKFLEAGPHPAGIVDGITNFADRIPIVFDDPIVPFWLAMFGWDESAPNAIPIAIVEEGRALLIDAKTSKIYVYDNSASAPYVHCYDDLDELLENVTVPTAASAARQTRVKRKTRAKHTRDNKKKADAKSVAKRTRKPRKRR